jgi:phosphonate ABC transporter permease subunit PhnE
MEKTPSESAEGAGPGRLARLGRPLLLFFAVVGAYVVYAYGFQVTKVNLEETKSPKRREGLVRILRAIAHPDLIEYDIKETSAQATIYVPCPGAPPAESPAPTAGPRLTLDPSCAAPGERVLVTGAGFPPMAIGPVFFVPPNGIQLSVGDMRTDRQGDFSLRAQLPERPDEQPQAIRAVARQNVGPPRLTRTAYDTWNKIIETVFLALLGTTFGTMVAVPLSFLAARNLMKDITASAGSVALTLLGLPVGGWIGVSLWRVAAAGSTAVTTNPIAGLASALAALASVLIILRWSMPGVEASPPTRLVRAGRVAGTLVASLLGLLALVLLARFMVFLGQQMIASLGLLAFLGAFLKGLGEILELILGAAAFGAGAAVVGGLGGRLGRGIHHRFSASLARVMDLVLSAAAGAALAIFIGAVLNWFYQVNDVRLTVELPAAAGGLLGLVISLRAGASDTLPVGLVVYNITRTVLNALRAIEPLIMVIVFAVWVGIGPFAGVLALSLHTVAALAKLYSEQVESIMPGPLEAVTATGATRLQTIVYAVVPQIIPPYISFTMYRWDINVRMSTIIGFAGGGGIGFLLQQNINLLNYRAASAQMLAIAFVVASMDYLSSYLRQKVV